MSPSSSKIRLAVTATAVFVALPCHAFQLNFARHTSSIFGAAPPQMRRYPQSISTTSSSATALFAKKKKGANAKTAALEALEALEETENQAAELFDEPLSKKEQMELQKKQKKMQNKPPEQGKEQSVNADDDGKNDNKELATATQQSQAKNVRKKKETLTDSLEAKNGMEEPEAPNLFSEPASASPKKKMNKKEEMLMKALEMDEMDSQKQTQESTDDQPKLNKKELKALKKQEEKDAAKKEAKMKKKQEKQAELDAEANGADMKGVNGDATKMDQANGSTEAAPGPEKSLTLEDKIRKDRPPPRIRVMESSQPGYTSLRLENVGITFRNQEVLKDVTWGVQTGDRIGLVGKNGAGKTTQLRIMAGELEPTTGDVVKSKRDLRVAVLRQEFVDELIPERTLKEEMLSVFEEENAILEELKTVETELANMGEDGSDHERMQQILDRMQELQNKAEEKDVYAIESRVKKVMDVMGFNEDEGEDLVASFSGGWKMRIGLGKVLLKDPNVLLLDEPTNHLDLDSVEWLEAFLREQNIPMVIVSHDREFLDQVCTKIVDAEGGLCTEYEGNYSRFLQLKKARMDAWQSAYNAQEKKIKEEKQWINKFKIKQPQAVKQRQAKLDKFMKSDEYVQKPPFEGKPFKFRFPDAPRLSPEVAEIKGMSHCYTNDNTRNRLFEEASLSIEKGDRIAVVGPNGSGKSTLLRLLTGREEPEEGTAKIVGQNVVASYFEQNQADALDLEKTVLETIQAASSGQSYNELRALLGQFLFKGDSVEKKVKFLSGGEKARLSLCCMLLEPANFLILDEPTNHLDIPAKEMLEEALQYFDGSVMIVSHDRYFISKVATTIIAIEGKNLMKYAGDYKYYMEQSKSIKEKVEARYVSGIQRIESAPVINLEELQKPKANFGGAKNAHMVTRTDKGVKNAKRMNK